MPSLPDGDATDAASNGAADAAAAEGLAARLAELHDSLPPDERQMLDFSSGGRSSRSIASPWWAIVC